MPLRYPFLITFLCSTNSTIKYIFTADWKQNRQEIIPGDRNLVCQSERHTKVLIAAKIVTVKIESIGFHPSVNPQEMYIQKPNA